MFQRIKTLLLKNQSTKQIVAKNVFWLTFANIGTRLLRSLIIIYAARILGASEYGIFSYVLGLAGFFSIFADIGINPILTKEIAKKPEDSHVLFATSFWIKMSLLVLTSLLIIGIAPFFSKIESVQNLLAFAAILTLFDGIRDFAIAFFRAKEKMELEALVTTLTNIAITVFGFIILRMAGTATALFTTYALSAGTGTIIAIFLLRKEFSKVFASFKKNLLKPLLTLAWPIALVSLVGIFMTNVDIVMLGYFRTTEDVGLYSAGQKIIQLIYVLPAILATGLYPTLSKFVGEKNNEKVKNVMEKGITTSLLIAIPLVIGGIILAENIILFLYRSGYVGAVLPFQVLLLTTLAIFPATHLSNYIMVYDEQRKVPWIILVSSVLNIGLNALFIPQFRAAGAAVATLIAQLFYQGLLWRLSKRINNFNTLRHLKSIMLASLLMGAVVFALQLTGIHIIINIVLGVLIYFAILLVLKEKTVLEIKTLVSRIKPPEENTV